MYSAHINLKNRNAEVALNVLNKEPWKTEIEWFSCLRIWPATKLQALQIGTDTYKMRYVQWMAVLYCI